MICTGLLQPPFPESQAPLSKTLSNFWCALQVYFMVDFRPDAAAFFYYLLMNIASLMMFTSFGFFLECATPMVELAQLFSR